ncbi:hypothetical protein EYF80_006324 [Liparis tanakae]|uniref:Uncharacterized protein n=1 Tax=Liparis tanakae TaxID=230148 RepID=A0A4Z2J1M8_9TELE|nr:hypothetical protein EYF80_006324 [Liparis tanakae]
MQREGLDQPHGEPRHTEARYATCRRSLSYHLGVDTSTPGNLEKRAPRFDRPTSAPPKERCRLDSFPCREDRRAVKYKEGPVTSGERIAENTMAKTRRRKHDAENTTAKTRRRKHDAENTTQKTRRRKQDAENHGENHAERGPEAPPRDSVMDYTFEFQQYSHNNVDLIKLDFIAIYAHSTTHEGADAMVQRQGAWLKIEEEKHLLLLNDARLFGSIPLEDQ